MHELMSEFPGMSGYKLRLIYGFAQMKPSLHMRSRGPVTPLTYQAPKASIYDCKRTPIVAHPVRSHPAWKMVLYINGTYAIKLLPA